MKSWLLFLGTYTRSGASRGLYRLHLDAATGALGPAELAAATPDPGWLAWTPDGTRLLATHPSPSQIIVFQHGPVPGELHPLGASPAPGATAGPSHLAVAPSGRLALAAHYHGGYLAAFPLHSDGTLGPEQRLPHAGRSVHPTRQDRPHPHSVLFSPDGRHALVADLGVDRIYTYALTPAGDALRPEPVAVTPTHPGAGPRHTRFSRDGRYLHVLNELDSTVSTYAYRASDGHIQPLGTVPALPADCATPNTAAEIRVHPAAPFVYTSNRGHDSLTVFEEDPANGALRWRQNLPSGGRTPRNFALSPDGRWLVCGHQDSPEVTVFAVDPGQGTLTPTAHRANVPCCVCVLFAPAASL
ncbi:MAG: 6-phosphogluconolactonase [Verrucomicrobiota bacterium]